MASLTYLGHACFFFETDTAACLIDPWLSPRGAFLGTWRQLPPNDHCLSWVLDKMKAKPVLIYVTHEHEDHYDEETLKVLLPYAEGLYMPRYENTFLKKLVEKNLRVQPHLIDENVEQRFHDIRFKIFIDESGINRDSAIFLKTEGLSFFDGNDCKIFDRATWLVEQCGSIDILSSQFSGANMHPICYEMKDDEYRKVSHQKKMRKFVAVRNYIADLKPRFYMPSAGPAIFPFPEHFHLNFEKETIFPKWWEFQEYLQEKGDPVEFIPLAVGSSAVADGKGQISFEKLSEKLCDEKLKDIIDYYRKIDRAISALPPVDEKDVLAFFERELSKKIAVLKKTPNIRLGCPLYIEIKRHKGASLGYRLDPEKCELEKWNLDGIHAPYYRHTTSIDALEKFMRSGKGWGTYFLAFLFRSKRDPDVFDSVLGTFFVANDDDDLAFGLERLIGFRESDEYITLTSADGQASVICRRFCPHQGADLKYAKFDGQHVVCPRHQWRFDCQNGGKADNSNDTIDATITKK